MTYYRLFFIASKFMKRRNIYILTLIMLFETHAHTQNTYMFGYRASPKKFCCRLVLTLVLKTLGTIPSSRFIVLVIPQMSHTEYWLYLFCFKKSCFSFIVRTWKRTLIKPIPTVYTVGGRVLVGSRPPS